MNELAIKQGTAKLAISNSARELIKACVSDNTLKAYRRALDSLAVWLDSELSDAVLAEYITHLHQSGKASSTNRTGRDGGQVESEERVSPG